MNRDPSELHGKLLALLLIGADEDGKKDWAVFFGTVEYEGGQLALNRGGIRPPIAIIDEWIERIRPVPDGTQDIFNGADYCLPLTIGNLPEGFDPAQSEYQDTGLTWPHAKRRKGGRRMMR
jgi:hypothetical protein